MKKSSRLENFKNFIYIEYTMVVEEVFRELQPTRCSVLSDTGTAFVGVVLDASPESLVSVGVLFTKVEAVDTQVQAALLVQHEFDVRGES